MTKPCHGGRRGQTEGSGPPYEEVFRPQNIHTPVDPKGSADDGKRFDALDVACVPGGENICE